MRFAFLVALAAALLVPAAASAHSSLVESTPAIGSTVESAPTEVRLRFSDPVTVPDGVVQVLDLAGGEHVEPGIEVDEDTVIIPVDGEGAGTRVVSWQAISDHGTEISGSFTYDIGGPTSGAAGGERAAGAGAVQREITDLTRAIAAGGVLLALVASAWLLAVRRRRRPIAAGIAAVAGCSAVTVVAVVIGGVVGGADFVSGTEEPPAIRLDQDISLGDGATATVSLEPTVAGITDLRVDVRTADGAADVGAREANVRYRPTDERFGYFRSELERDGKGGFAAEGVVVPFPGEWEFEVTVSEDEFASSLARFTADIQPNPELEQ